MVGITSYGGYIPLWRLPKESIAREWGQPPVPGEKAVASFDEDSITMSVAAAIDCLDGLNRDEVDALFFASTTPPYAEKQAASVVAICADLRTDMLTADYGNSLRAGTIAMRAAVDAVKAGTAKRAMVTAADMRIGTPRSTFEQNLGDGAAALLFGDTDVIAEIEGYHTISSSIIDVWRAEGETKLSSWEERFVSEEGYLKVVREAVSACLEKCGLAPKDISKAAYYASDSRRHGQMARALGLDAKTQIQDPLFGTVGCTGTAHAMMLLVAALEEAKPGDRILVANYGDGVDAYVLRVTEQIEKVRDRRGIRGHLQAKRALPDYATYMQWRDLVEVQPTANRPPMLSPSASALQRERDSILRFHGVKCRSCGTVQYPKQRICTKCRSKDDFEDVTISDKKGKVFTYSMDYIAGSTDVPLVIAIVNFDGGGRALLELTDRDINEVKIDMPVEFSLRRLYTAGGIHNYFWKAIPLRA